MDPTQALANLLRNAAQGNIYETEENAEALYRWLANGGALPGVSEALKRACLDDLGLYGMDSDDEGKTILAVEPPSYWTVGKVHV